MRMYSHGITDTPGSPAALQPVRRWLKQASGFSITPHPPLAGPSGYHDREIISSLTFITHHWEGMHLAAIANIMRHLASTLTADFHPIWASARHNGELAHMLGVKEVFADAAYVFICKCIQVVFAHDNNVINFSALEKSFFKHCISIHVHMCLFIH